MKENLAQIEWLVRGLVVAPAAFLAAALIGPSTIVGAILPVVENDGLHWARRDGLKWPHFVSVVVLG